MIAGQVMDLEAEEHKPTAELVEAIHRAKTGALIRVSLVTGGIYAGGTADDIERLREFGRKAGLAFQIMDDVLDVTQNSIPAGQNRRQGCSQRESDLARGVWGGTEREGCGAVGR